jgi:UTP--glucose-1-phosphate uridylyltransferase
MANFIYVRQIPKYGNGMPILSAASLVDDEPFVYCYGDDVVKSKTSFTKKMVEDFEKNGVPILGAQEVPADEVDRYGIAKLREGTNEIEDVIEKPPIDEAPSRLALFGRMILNQEIINALKETKPGKDGEVWVTDAIKNYIEAGNICHVQKVLDGEWMTTGDPLNYLKAILAYAQDRPELKAFLKEYLKSL